MTLLKLSLAVLVSISGAQVAFMNNARADSLGGTIAEGIAHEGASQGLDATCEGASGAGAEACAVRSTVNETQQAISNEVNESIDESCENASGVGSTACDAVDVAREVRNDLVQGIRRINPF